MARQIAERLGKVPQTWMLEYITNLVNSAVATEDMEKRLGGSMARPGVQMVWDAVEAQGREKAQASSSAGMRFSGWAAEAPPRGKRVKHRKPLGRAKMDSSKEEEAVLKLLCLELEAAKAPMLKDLEKVHNKERAMHSLKGKYRISTIRRYLGYWQHFRRWVANTSGFSVPNSVVQYVDYQYVDYL